MKRFTTNQDSEEEDIVQDLETQEKGSRLQEEITVETLFLESRV